MLNCSQILYGISTVEQLWSITLQSVPLFKSFQATKRFGGTDLTSSNYDVTIRNSDNLSDLLELYLRAGSLDIRIKRLSTCAQNPPSNNQANENQ
jgi:hypothetical protein